MLDLRSILALPAIYRLFGRLIAGNTRAIYVRDYIRPKPGDRVFDIGCGPGDILSYLPEVHYVGIDIEPKYIDAARARFGARGEFHCEDVSDAVVREAGSFDIVLANGVLHHLNDTEARKLLSLARLALKPSGRLITFDGCFVPGQSRLARWLLRMDRGHFVRSPEAYIALAAEVFGEVHSHIRHDLLRVPYTINLLVCSGVAGARQPVPSAA
jgi:SAM-dependent methyltransferase